METRRDVFQAIADPIRRQIINLLAHEPMNLTAIAKHFAVSRPAVSNHINILSECEIIRIEQIGRERYCKIQPASLIPAFMWMEQHQKLWEDKLESFEDYLMKLQTKKDQQ